MKITIIGAGKLGVMLAKTLTAENHDITIIDINEDRVGKLVEMLDVQGISGSATHYDVLDEADMKNCDLLICTTPSDENNILSCLIAKKMGAKHTIARVRNPEYSSQMNFMRDELGISMMINPDLQLHLKYSEYCNFLPLPLLNRFLTEEFIWQVLKFPRKVCWQIKKSVKFQINILIRLSFVLFAVVTMYLFQTEILLLFPVIFYI